MTIQEVEFRKLKEAVEVLNGDRGDKDRSQSAIRRVQIKEVEKFIADVKESASVIRKNLEALVVEVVDAQQEILELTARISNTEQNLQILEDDLTALDGRIQTLQGQADGIESQLAEAQDQLDAITLDVTAISTTLSNIRTGVAAVGILPLTSSNLSLPPSASDYNALRDDVVNLRQALVSIKAAITA